MVQHGQYGHRCQSSHLRPQSGGPRLHLALLKAGTHPHTAGCRASTGDGFCQGRGGGGEDASSLGSKCHKATAENGLPALLL